MMVLTSGTWRRGVTAAVLVLVLAACGTDDTSTDAGSSGDGGADVASASDADVTDEDHDDDGDHEEEDHEDEGDHEDHDDEDHGDESDHDEDHDDEDHDDEDHDDHDDDASGGLGAHEHGLAELSVAWSEGEVIIDLISPTHNIFGFEREPSTDEEEAIVADRTEALTEPGVIAINEEAGCEPVGETITELEFDGSHAEMTASWLFSCDNPDEISQLDVGTLFAEFPNLEDIDAQWASPSGQSAAELTPSSTVLDLG